MSLRGGVGLHAIMGLDPDYLQRGPYEASEGIYPDRGRGKTGGKFSTVPTPSNETMKTGRGQELGSPGKNLKKYLNPGEEMV